MRHRDEQGMSLVEICLALVVLGLVVSSLLAALATSSTASSQHRDLVSADAALRNYAEATKLAVRQACDDNATYTPPTTEAAFPVTGADGTCPPKSGALTPVTLTVTLPNGAPQTMDIIVRSP
jgi:type II secretory pathway pseudopilin PulG